jgi:hypothetical protein
VAKRKGTAPKTKRPNILIIWGDEARENEKHLEIAIGGGVK